jgi:hypothetical protein
VSGDEEEPPDHDRASISEEAVGQPSPEERTEEDEQQVVRPQRRGLRVRPAEALRLVLEVEREQREHRVEAEALPQLDAEENVEAPRVSVVRGRNCGDGPGCAHEVAGRLPENRGSA